MQQIKKLTKKERRIEREREGQREISFFCSVCDAGRRTVASWHGLKKGKEDHIRGDGQTIVKTQKNPLGQNIFHFFFFGRGSCALMIGYLSFLGNVSVESHKMHFFFQY